MVPFQGTELSLAYSLKVLPSVIVSATFDDNGRPKNSATSTSRREGFSRKSSIRSNNTCSSLALAKPSTNNIRFIHSNTIRSAMDSPWN
eukprot:CAMPEP_0204088776 /NCGR_PEP_ID=MMETSP0360-20130528/186744_1 /ASSEMBLY_ACC=CAM_ASM_000342 /TAXON_ID=268821 /ORGANISM="Scrippsiella Hangoei, Strain SHTV-5" /LENGTH=88 /DNA_ID=CAMNT_0051037969 /DNA_START=18 /DNA_END=281 /DNA_ORIENTATION=+